jgi:Ca-activated chloride channel family protein
MNSVLRLGLAIAAVSATHVDAFQFRSGTELVPVFVTVHEGGRLVPDLKQEDFTITDNGKEQPITHFSNEITPFSAIVILDRSGSMYQHQYVIRDAAMSFVVRMLPDDQARIGSFGNYFGNRVVISPPTFTSNKADLIDVLQAPIGLGGASPVWISVDQSITALSGTPGPGRRVVVIFSDGYDEPMPSMVPVKMKDVIERSRLTNTMIYSIGFADVQQRQGKDPKIRPPHDDLQKVAEESGGGYFEVSDTNKLGDTFTRVIDELHRQYWLGFVPSVRDGKIHKIAVRVKNKSMTVRARQSYVAPGG